LKKAVSSCVDGQAGTIGFVGKMTGAFESASHFD
jgi:hypothetical protein